MSELQTKINRIEEKPKEKLKEILAAELGESYNREITNSLRNDFLNACYKEIAPNEDPIQRAKTHEEYSSSWRKKRVLATALRMLLADRGVRENHNPLISLDKPALAQLIVAIRNEEVGSSMTMAEKQSNESPERVPPQNSKFQNGLRLNESQSTDELQSWVDNEKQSSNLNHAVYVLDCTPPIGDEENSLKSLRSRTEKKTEPTEEWTKMEKAAAATTRGERIYYVGYTNDVIDRVERHLGGAAHGGAQFTHTFAPQALVEVNFYHDEQTARQHEPKRAEELTEAGTSFGYFE